jgi:glutamine amidotransferase-like uncharacterized protein
MRYGPPGRLGPAGRDGPAAGAFEHGGAVLTLYGPMKILFITKRTLHIFNSTSRLISYLSY